MNRKKIIIVFLCTALAVPVIGYTQSGRSLGKNVESILEQILANQQKMQADIDLLKKQLVQKDREIAALKEMIQKRDTAVEQKIEAISARPVTAATGPAPTDFYSARLQYDVARTLQHDVIFNIRRGEQKPWFERVIVEFRKVVDGYPTAPEAAESQLRIARIYHRYLNDIAQARKEYQLLIDKYPDNPNVKEAQDRLSQLKGN